MTSDLASATFDHSPADLVDVCMRHARATGNLRRMRTAHVALSVAAGSLLAWLLRTWMLPTESAATGWGFVGAATLGICVLAAWRAEAHFRRAIRRQVERRAPGGGTCTVSLRADAVCTEQPGLRWECPWSDLVHIRDDGTDIEFLFRRGITVVRGRAFPDAASRAEFVATARRLHAAAR